MSVPMSTVAIVGMACRYPDAASPNELWENAIAGRRAFRRLPDVRMRLEDYWDADPATPDKFYARNAAVIEGYEFDRVGYKIAGSTYRSTDLTHWLALDIAARALADAGFPLAQGLSRENTGVVIGNTLTGEFSRANTLRLRWPFVRRTVAAALRQRDWNDHDLGDFLEELEAVFKDPFPAIDEDTLAGGLSNTIAGRICNYFDLKGGGYTVDGACSSSLLSVATACQRLVDGELDVAIAGGVDLSIDPFEIIGFAKTGALATGEMRLYDRGSNGFWPGEGCGMVVLMRESDARDGGHQVYATIRGWGVSSDGKGGITRPEVDGYQLALRRAYARAGFGIETVAMFEGHGTGTKVGDATELKALSSARKAAGGQDPAAISSIKGMIGHTKAAAGVAGLIKAVMAVHHRIVPPTIGCVEPHELLSEGEPGLRVLRKAEAWPANVPVRAGITAMGFGGINTHVVVEGKRPRRNKVLDRTTRALAASIQDAELLALDAATSPELDDKLAKLIAFVPTLSYAQLGDLAATLRQNLTGQPWRAAAVVTSPEGAERQLTELRRRLDAGESSVAADSRSFIGHVGTPGRVGFLFPGQGSGRGVSGGALRRRFAEAEAAYVDAALPTGKDIVATEVAQPRIVTGSLAGLRVLSLLGIDATVAVGHSLGEISALCWAGAMDERALLRIAGVRGRTMSRHSSSGTMAGIGAPPSVVGELINGLPVVIAAYNGPDQTVIAGTVEAIDDACARARRDGLSTTRLSVSHAFHSPLVAPAADAFGKTLERESFKPIGRPVVSTITGETLPSDVDIPELLRRQIIDPVLFQQAVKLAAPEVDLFIEVGPGRVLTGLAGAVTDVPAVALDTDDESLAGVLRVVAAAFVIGAAGVDEALFRGRLVRPLKLDAQFTFLASPCETPPPVQIRAPRKEVKQAQATPRKEEGESSLQLLLRLAAERAELPLESVHEHSHLLDDLHLSSITVGQIVNQVAQRLGVNAALAPTNFATATARELADALDSLSDSQTDTDTAPTIVAGARAWARPWRLDLDEVALPRIRPPAESNGRWRCYSEAEHPLCEPLRKALEAAQVGPGVLVCLPEGCTEEQLDLALLGAKAILRGDVEGRFVLVQHDRGAAGLAKTLRLEAPRVRTTVVHVPPIHQAVQWVVAEVAATTRFSEAFYDSKGGRRVPTLRAMPVHAARTEQPLGADDVLLVTGGGKGITAECALALASASGAKLALLGRSDPTADEELAANLERVRRHGVTVAYARADVVDPAQVRHAVDELAGELGPITAILHGAGRNEPAGLTSLDGEAFRRTLAPKIDGLRAVIEAVEPDRLRLLVTLGSIIGRAGLRGEAHYATANEWLAELTHEIGEKHPNCRTLCLEWSVWSGVGMGERLAVVESLRREGIEPITPEQGVQILRRLVEDPQAPELVVISGRTEGIDTVRYDLPELPLLRFIQRPLIRYHGVELVTEVELSAGTDQYLDDHRLDGNLLFPAVFGMEAMVQVSNAMTGREAAPVIEDVELLRPIVVPPNGSTTIRIAAAVTADDTAEVVIRSAETGFAADHFRARVRWNGAVPQEGAPELSADGLAPVPLDPSVDLYGDTMFQGARFHRLRGYHRAAARNVDADVAAVPVTWFAGYLPDRLLLGDPGVRDALMHGNQVCVPDATLLPVGVRRLYPAGESLSGHRKLRLCSVERERDSDRYTYDIALRDEDGRVVERWDGLVLQAVRKKDGRGPWLPVLLGSHFERALGDVADLKVAVAVEPDGVKADETVAQRRKRSAVAIGRTLGAPAKVRYRPDGRPEVSGGRSVSASHGAGVTFAVAGKGTIGCDVETVAHRELSVWRGLLGPHHALVDLIAKTTGEDVDTAGTRVWAAIECLQKAGLPPSSPLALLTADRPGWTVMASGDLRIAALATTLRDQTDAAVFAVLSGARDDG